MEVDNIKVIEEIKNALEMIVIGKKCDTLTAGTDSHELNEVISLVNMLISNVSELSEFSIELSKGNLGVFPPGKRNYLAAPVKALHSQLNSLVWKINQLKKGLIVEHLDYMGEISESFNGLLDVVSDLFSNAGDVKSTRDKQRDEQINSWRYHQIVATLNHLPLMVMLADETGKIAFLNHKAERKLGNIENLNETREQGEDTHLLLSSISEPQLNGMLLPNFQEVFSPDSGLWYKITTDMLHFPNNQHFYIHTIEDISEWKLSEQKLQISATTDPLTGVYNRAAGFQELKLAMNNCKSSDDGCIAFIDIDSLKYINDTFGHNEGDYAISTIARMISQSAREDDIVCRFGGDEFVIIFSKCSTQSAEKIIGRMYEKLDVINEESEKPFKLSFSHGLVSLYNENNLSIKDMIQLADKKMYEQKTSKKARADSAMLL